MIRNGREVVDLRGIAELHGLPWHTARRRRPWAAEGHPTPVTSASRRVPPLYDLKQVAAYAEGRRVPPLPTRDHPRDLLDAHDARRLLDLTESTWRVYDYEGRLPPPDSAPYGVPHWSRTTLAAWAKRRPGPGWWGDHIDAASAGERARQAVEHAATLNESITDAELARLARVSRPTLRKARENLATRKRRTASAASVESCRAESSSLE